jgi:hypothetical protein
VKPMSEGSLHAENEAVHSSGDQNHECNTSSQREDDSCGENHVFRALEDTVRRRLRTLECCAER